MALNLTNWATRIWFFFRIQLERRIFSRYLITSDDYNIISMNTIYIQNKQYVL
jgi:hypothetical protein